MPPYPVIGIGWDQMLIGFVMLRVDKLAGFPMSDWQAR
jgi:hypothetical protein